MPVRIPLESEGTFLSRAACKVHTIHQVHQVRCVGTRAGAGEGARNSEQSKR